MKVVLYAFPGGDGLTSVSPPCVKVEMALKRARAEYRVVYLKSRPEVRRVSATGRLPLLEIDGRRIPDSVEILDELERRFPDAGLAPSDPQARTRDRLWEHFFNEHVYFLGYYMRWISEGNRERWLKALFKSAPLLIKLLGPPALRRETRKRAVAIGIAGRTEDEVMRSAERAMEMAEVGLAGGPFLEGREAPGRGDLAAAAVLGQAGFRDTLPDFAARLRKRTALIEHSRRVFAACSMETPHWLAG